MANIEPIKESELFFTSGRGEELLKSSFTLFSLFYTKLNELIEEVNRLNRE